MAPNREFESQVWASGIDQQSTQERGRAFDKIANAASGFVDRMTDERRYQQQVGMQQQELRMKQAQADAALQERALSTMETQRRLDIMRMIDEREVANAQAEGMKLDVEAKRLTVDKLRQQLNPEEQRQQRIWAILPHFRDMARFEVATKKRLGSSMQWEDLSPEDYAKAKKTVDEMDKASQSLIQSRAEAYGAQAERARTPSASAANARLKEVADLVTETRKSLYLVSDPEERRVVTKRLKALESRLDVLLGVSDEVDFERMFEEDPEMKRMYEAAVKDQ